MMPQLIRRSLKVLAAFLGTLILVTLGLLTLYSPADAQMSGMGSRPNVRTLVIAAINFFTDAEALIIADYQNIEQHRLTLEADNDLAWQTNAGADHVFTVDVSSQIVDFENAPTVGGVALVDQDSLDAGFSIAAGVVDFVNLPTVAGVDLVDQDSLDAGFSIAAGVVDFVNLPTVSGVDLVAQDSLDAGFSIAAGVVDFVNQPEVAGVTMVAPADLIEESSTSGNLAETGGNDCASAVVAPEFRAELVGETVTIEIQAFSCEFDTGRNFVDFSGIPAAYRPATNEYRSFIVPGFCDDGVDTHTPLKLVIASNGVASFDASDTGSCGAGDTMHVVENSFGVPIDNFAAVTYTIN